MSLPYVFVGIMIGLAMLIFGMMLLTAWRSTPGRALSRWLRRPHTSALDIVQTALVIIAGVILLPYAAVLTLLIVGMLPFC